MNNPRSAKPIELTPAVAAEDLRAQVQRIVESPWFSSAPRLTRFLQFAVESLISGATDQLKESVLGRVVFDRGSSFDPRTDSIVRVDSQRLRRKLAEYYNNDGRNDRVMVTFQAGSYIPLVSYVEGGLLPPKGGEWLMGSKLSPQIIAVLPFDNLSPDWEQDYFCEGITDDIIHSLSGIPGLRVIGHTSAFALQRATHDVREAGRRVGAGTIVDGSVRKYGDDLRIFAEIIDAETGHVSWAETYDRTLGDIFSIQAEIAEAVARVLQMTLAPTVSRRLVQSAPNMDAYTMYLRGRHAWNRMSGEGFGIAIDLFEQCTLLYPTYAAAHAGLADAYASLALWGVLRPRDVLPKAEQAAQRALQLDPLLAQGYSSSAVCAAFFHWKWEEGIALARRSTELNPSSRTGRHIHGACLMAAGRPDEALDSFEQAVALDPFSVQAHRTLGWALYLRRRLAGAEKWLAAALEIHSEPAQTNYLLANVMLAQKRYPEALLIAQQCQTDPPDPLMLGLLGACLGHLERHAEATEIANRLHTMQANGWVDPFALCQVYLSLNKTDAVLEHVEQCLEERTPLVAFLDVDPAFDPVRNDSRFRKLISRSHTSDLVPVGQK
jgi:serine/threonine-protein kinase